MLDNLLGQKLINIDLQEKNSLFMLTLEIPLKFNEQNKLLPLFLKIAEKEKNKNTSKSKNTGRSYEITLITELPLIGTIKSTVELKNKNLSALFLSETDKTKLLVENNLENLQIILENQGFKISNLKTAVFEKNISEQCNFFNEVILSEFDLDTNLKEKYTHLDIRV